MISLAISVGIPSAVHDRIVGISPLDCPFILGHIRLKHLRGYCPRGLVSCLFELKSRRHGALQRLQYLGTGHFWRDQLNHVLSFWTRSREVKLGLSDISEGSAMSLMVITLRNICHL